MDNRRMNLTITEPTEYVDKSYPTASCWWVKYELQPGTYEIVPWSNLPYYFHALVKAKRIEEHFVNRVFQYSKIAEPSGRIGTIEEVWIDAPNPDKFAEVTRFLKYNPTYALTP